MNFYNWAFYSESGPSRLSYRYFGWIRLFYRIKPYYFRHSRQKIIYAVNTLRLKIAFRLLPCVGSLRAEEFVRKAEIRMIGGGKTKPKRAQSKRK